MSIKNVVNSCEYCGGDAISQETINDIAEKLLSSKGKGLENQLLSIIKRLTQPDKQRSALVRDKINQLWKKG